MKSARSPSFADWRRIASILQESGLPADIDNRGLGLGSMIIVDYPDWQVMVSSQPTDAPDDPWIIGWNPGPEYLEGDVEQFRSRFFTPNRRPLPAHGPPEAAAAMIVEFIREAAAIRERATRHQQEHLLTVGLGYARIAVEINTPTWAPLHASVLPYGDGGHEWVAHITNPTDAQQAGFAVSSRLSGIWYLAPTVGQINVAALRRDAASYDRSTLDFQKVGDRFGFVVSRSDRIPALPWKPLRGEPPGDDSQRDSQERPSRVWRAVAYHAQRLRTPPSSSPPS